MPLVLSEEQASLVDSISTLVRREFGVTTSARDLNAASVREMLPRLSSNGFAGINIPVDLGGQGGGMLDAVLAIEAAAKLNPVAGDAVQALNFGAVQQVAHHGTADHQHRFLAPCLQGELLTAIAMTEPAAGSAVGELSTSARVDGTSVYLSGSKVFTSHGASADFFVVWVRFGPERRDIGAVIVERNAPGFTIDDTHTFMSGEPYGVLYFDDAAVPAENILLDGDGFRRMLSVFNVERLGNAARALALGQAAFDLAVSHANTREQFGARLIDKQGLQWMLAEAHVQLEGARLLLRQSAASADAGTLTSGDTAMAKLACNRAGYMASDTALQILGGSGFDSESLVNYHFRRTRGWMIAGGTVEQMLNRIARGFVESPSSSDASSLPHRR